MNCRREERSSVLAMASGRSAKRRAISCGRFQMALGIARKQAAGGGERAVMADAGEDVQNFALLAAARSRRHWWQAAAVAAFARFRRRPDCALPLRGRNGAAIRRKHCRGRRFRQSSCTHFVAAVDSALRQRMRQRAFVASGQADQAVDSARRFLRAATLPSPFRARNFMRVIRRHRFW